jgi:hypothetical protein
MTDHRRTADPYLSLYKSETEALKQLDIDVRKTGYICVTELAVHMEKYTRAHYGSDYHWYHDALIQLTDVKAREWLRDRGMLKHWILPEYGLNANVWGKGANGKWTYSAVYANRPVGDSPELMPLDCHLNKDARDAVEFHAAITESLDSWDVCKFDQTTPTKLRDAYLRLLHPGNVCTCTREHCECGALPPRRIQEDVLRVVPSLWKIAEARGAVVQGLGNRNGDRRVRAQWSLVEERRGGKRPTRAERLEQIREAGGPQSLWIHRDARVAWEAILNGGESGRGSDSE